MFIKVVRLRTILFCVLLTFLLGAGIILLNESSLLKSVFGPQSHDITLVIDAGHGGMDGGASGATGTTEQHINLSIAKRTQSLAGFFGVSTVMTREDEQSLDYKEGASIRRNKVADIKKRESIALSVKNPVFLSIHLNQFDDVQYKGAQVFYSKNNPEGALLAKALQESMVSGLDKSNKRKEKQALDTIYLLKKLRCPAVIVECGFLSNPQEEKLLINESYHKKAALCIIRGYLNYLQQADAT